MQYWLRCISDIVGRRSVRSSQYLCAEYRNIGGTMKRQLYKKAIKYCIQLLFITSQEISSSRGARSSLGCRLGFRNTTSKSIYRFFSMRQQQRQKGLAMNKFIILGGKNIVIEEWLLTRHEIVSSTLFILLINSSFSKKAHTEHTVYKVLTHHSLHVTTGWANLM